MVRTLGASLVIEPLYILLLGVAFLEGWAGMAVSAMFASVAELPSAGPSVADEFL